MRASDFDFDLPPELIAQEPFPLALLVVLMPTHVHLILSALLAEPGRITAREVVVLQQRQHLTYLRFDLAPRR